MRQIYRDEVITDSQGLPSPLACPLPSHSPKIHSQFSQNGPSESRQGLQAGLKAPAPHAIDPAPECSNAAESGAGPSICLSPHQAQDMPTLTWLPDPLSHCAWADIFSPGSWKREVKAKNSLDETPRQPPLLPHTIPPEKEHRSPGSQPPLL